MELNFMRFCGKPFGYCAVGIGIESSKRIKTYGLCGGGNAVQSRGRDLRTVSGKGEIPQPSENETRRMRRMFVLGDHGTLAIPGQAPFYAVLKRLDFSETKDGGATEYEFEFTELPRAQAGPEYLIHTAKKGENLWTIAALYARSVEELISLNPSIRRPDRLKTGEEVVVRWR